MYIGKSDRITIPNLYRREAGAGLGAGNGFCDDLFVPLLSGKDKI